MCQLPTTGCDEVSNAFHDGLCWVVSARNLELEFVSARFDLILLTLDSLDIGRSALHPGRRRDPATCFQSLDKSMCVKGHLETLQRLW